MKPELYLDSSALAKLYVREPRSVDLAEFLRKHRPPIHYSSLHELEISRVFSSRRAEGDLAAADQARAVSALNGDLKNGVLLRPELEWPGAFAIAIQLVRRHRSLRSLDALHIGCARELGARLFVTYDQRQGSAASAEGLAVWP